MTRRIAALVALPLVAACSLQFGSSTPASLTPPVAVPPKSPSVLTASMMEQVPAEVAFSIHYRRSTEAHNAFKPMRDWVEQLLPELDLSPSEVLQVAAAYDVLAQLDTVDMIVAAPTDALKSVDDLEELMATKTCVVVAITSDPGMLTQQIETMEVPAPFTKTWKGNSGMITGPNCAAYPALATTEAVQKYAAAMVPSGAAFAVVEHPGHALIHDPILWAFVAEQYNNGKEEALAAAPDRAVVEALVTDMEQFVTHLNVWKLIQSEKLALASWTPTKDMWTLDLRLDAGDAKLASIAQRSIVGMFEAGVLYHSETVEQVVASAVEGTNAIIHLEITNPDMSVLLGGNGMGAMMLAGVASSGAVALFENAQQKAYESAYDAETYEQELQWELENELPYEGAPFNDSMLDDELGDPVSPIPYDEEAPGI